MTNRLVLVGLGLFWVTMNVLLWRAEFGGSATGSPVGLQTVWQRILTAPDDSSLEILHRGRRIGRCRWAATIGEAPVRGRASDRPFEPEGRIKETTGYSLDVVDGNLVIEEPVTYLRFSLHGGFAQDHTWRELGARINLRPNTWEVRVLAREERLLLKVEDENGKWERSYTFAELRNPQRMIRDLTQGSPLLGTSIALSLLGQSPLLPNPAPQGLGITWEAYNDWMKLGPTQVRVYRLQTRLLEQYSAVIWISRAGEILRVELPEDVVLVNEALIY